MVVFIFKKLKITPVTRRGPEAVKTLPPFPPVRFGLLFLLLYFIINDTLQKMCAGKRQPLRAGHLDLCLQIGFYIRLRLI